MDITIHIAAYAQTVLTYCCCHLVEEACRQHTGGSIAALAGDILHDATAVRAEVTRLLEINRQDYCTDLQDNKKRNPGLHAIIEQILSFGVVTHPECLWRLAHECIDALIPALTHIDTSNANGIQELENIVYGVSLRALQLVIHAKALEVKPCGEHCAANDITSK